jgi:hypothetical protein
VERKTFSSVKVDPMYIAMHKGDVELAYDLHETGASVGDYNIGDRTIISDNYRKDYKSPADALEDRDKQAAIVFGEKWEKFLASKREALHGTASDSESGLSSGETGGKVEAAGPAKDAQNVALNEEIGAKLALLRSSAALSRVELDVMDRQFESQGEDGGGHGIVKRR